MVAALAFGDHNRDRLRRARLVLRLVTIYISLAIPPWIGAVSTGDGPGDRWGRNGEFCVAVGPVTRTAGILSY